MTAGGRLTFLFWNTNGKYLGDALGQLVVEHDVDVLMLAEPHPAPMATLAALNAATEMRFFYAASRTDCRLQIFSRFTPEMAPAVQEGSLYGFRQLKMPGVQQLLLGYIHAPSKLYMQDESQSFWATQLSGRVAEAESLVGHSRTILFGDFNCNPFEPGMVSAGGLHAVSSRVLAQRGGRKVQGQIHPFFYNPSWRLLGDSPEPPGSYYYAKAEHFCYHWNVFDQVLIRPEIAHLLVDSMPRLLTTAGSTPLTTKSGRPRRSALSDHLPLLCRLESDRS